MTDPHRGRAGAAWRRLAWGLVAAGLPALALAQSRLAPGAPLGALPRFGVNLGHRTAWGAEQLMANVLRNPGLESAHDGALVIAGRIGPRSVQDDSPWTVRPDGFWTGARFEVLSGTAAGQGGRIADDRLGPPPSAQAGGRGATVFELDPMPAGLQPGDVIAVEGEQDLSPAPMWWTQGTVRAAQDDGPPGTEGRQSLRLLAAPGRPAVLAHHLDTIGARAGRLLPVRGRWQVALWLRGRSADAEVQVRFMRHGSRAWVDRTLAPGPAWTRLAIEFDARDDGPVGPLEFSVTVRRGEAMVDDLMLGPAQAGPGGFRAEVVETLRALQPGYLREWQGQLADTPDNRVASPGARRPVRHRPGEAEFQFAYGLDEFCALAAAVGARPWVVLPSTSTPAQARAFGQALAAQWRRHRFDEIVVEHGNEHWNSVFRPAGIAAVPVLAQVADRAFAALREGAGPGVPLHPVVGTQYVQPAAARQMAQASRQAAGIAVAPYLLHRLDRAEDAAGGLARALAEPVGPLLEARRALAPAGRSLDVYEVNLHTTSGDAPPAVRDAVVTAPAAGTALARRLMMAAAAGVTRQAVYSLAAFDTPTAQRDLVRLFGITRDLATPARWRATGLALAQLNAVAGGAAAAGRCEGAGCAALTALAFDAGRRWAVASASAATEPVSWACQGPQAVGWLDGSAAPQPEDAAPAPVWRARVVPCEAGMARFDLPARSLMTARPEGAAR